MDVFFSVAQHCYNRSHSTADVHWGSRVQGSVEWRISRIVGCLVVSRMRGVCWFIDLLFDFGGLVAFSVLDTLREGTFEKKVRYESRWKNEAT